jgi:hypothetical protein
MPIPATGGVSWVALARHIVDQPLAVPALFSVQIFHRRYLLSFLLQYNLISIIQAYHQIQSHKTRLQFIPWLCSYKERDTLSRHISPRCPASIQLSRIEIQARSGLCPPKSLE